MNNAITSSSNLRPLSVDELDQVSGGERKLIGITIERCKTIGNGVIQRCKVITVQKVPH